MTLRPCGVSLEDLKRSADDTPHFLFPNLYGNRSDTVFAATHAGDILLDNLFLLVYHVTGNLEQIAC